MAFRNRDWKVKIDHAILFVAQKAKKKTIDLTLIERFPSFAQNDINFYFVLTINELPGAQTPIQHTLPITFQFVPPYSFTSL